MRIFPLRDFPHPGDFSPCGFFPTCGFSRTRLRAVKRSVSGVRTYPHTCVRAYSIFSSRTRIFNFFRAHTYFQFAHEESPLPRKGSGLVSSYIMPRWRSHEGFPCSHVPSGSTQHPSSASQPPSATQSSSSSIVGSGIAQSFPSQEKAKTAIPTTRESAMKTDTAFFIRSPLPSSNVLYHAQLAGQGNFGISFQEASPLPCPQEAGW